MLLPGIGSAASWRLAQPAHSHANQYFYTHHDVYAGAADGYASTAHWHSDRNGDHDSFLHAFAHLYTIPHADRHPNRDTYACPADVYLYACAANVDKYPRSADTDRDGYANDARTATATAAQPLNRAAK